MKFNIFNFKLGKQKRDFKYYLNGSLFIKLPVELISLIPGIEKKKVFNLLDVVQLKLNIDAINDYIIKDDEFLSYRIEREVNKALEDNGN